MNEDLIKVYQEMLALSKVEKDLRYRNVKIYERDYIHELYTLSNKNPDTSTGNDNSPSMAVVKNAQIVIGIFHIVIPLVLRFNTVVI